MSAQCPHSMELVAQKAKIESLEKEIENLKACRNSKILEPAKQINRLAEIAKVNADFLIQDKARRAGFIKAIHTTATLIGYAVIILALLVANKFTGTLEFFVKFITLLFVK